MFKYIFLAFLTNSLIFSTANLTSLPLYFWFLIFFYDFLFFIFFVCSLLSLTVCSLTATAPFIYAFTVIGQQTTPPELPIYGDPYTEIALELVFPKGNPTFLLDGKKLQLLQPLDRDEENLSHIVFQVSARRRPQANC